LEICKSDANGAPGTTFSFTVSTGGTVANGGAEVPGSPVSVPGGECVDAISVVSGKPLFIVENNTPDWVMTGDTVLPDAEWISDNFRQGLVKAQVETGQETQVTVTNAPAGATIKVCKTTSSPALMGKQYSFTVGTTVVQATSNTTAGPGACSTPVPTQIGSKVKITEATPPNEAVDGITYSPTGIKVTVLNQAANVATIKTQAGANVVTFDNTPVGPPQTGYIEICKDAYDYYVNGLYHFEITTTGGTSLDPGGEDVLVGQCTAPIKVPAGPVLVTESANKSTELNQVWTDPANALGLVNLANQTAVVVVPVSDSATGEVQVHFVNKTLVATLKICKLLPAGSEALAGTIFHFHLTTDATDSTVWNVDIVASAGVNGACKIVTDRWGNPVLFPVGAKATAIEDGLSFVSGDGGASGDNDKQSTTIVGGINNITFTNVALGQLEICKRMIIGEEGLHQSFTFNYAGASAWNKSVKGTVKIAAFTCSLPQVVPAGNYTVTEDLSKLQVQLGGPTGPKVNAFQFVASDARGPLDDNRCVPPQSTPDNVDALIVTIINTNCGNPATVSVPYFNSADPVKFGETQVTFWNKETRGSIKICKQVTSDSTASIGNTTFNFAWSVSGDGSGITTLKPGTCTGNLGNFAIATNSGTTLVPAVATVTEQLNPASHVSNVTLTGGGPISGFSPPSNTVTFNPGPGVNVVTYYNTANPAANA